MILGYNTNGFAHHRLDDTFPILADIGYAGVALTPDVHHLDPLGTDSLRQIEHWWRAASRWNFAFVIETGARFLLDPLRKHQPTLISPRPAERQQRLDFLRRCVQVARIVNSPVISFWSGSAVDEAAPDELMHRLSENCRRLADEAATHGIRLAFEPEPGMFIDTMSKFAELHERVNHPNFGLTIDIGHLVCQNEIPVSAHLERWQHRLWNVHIDDMNPGVHDHLLFGEGSVDFPDVFQGLRRANYHSMVSVELSRHSHDAVRTAQRSFDFLSQHLQ